MALYHNYRVYLSGRANNYKCLCTNSEAPKYIKQLRTNISNLIDKNVVITGDFNTSLTTMDRSSRQKISEETMALNDTLNQMNLTDIFISFHPKTEEYTFFSSAHGTFSKIDHILGHKTALNKYKRDRKSVV